VASQTHHSIGGQQVEKVAGDVPLEKVVPKRSLKVIARIQIDRVLVFSRFVEFFHFGHHTSIAAYAFLYFAVTRR
jgi:hypothetical protein